MRKGAGAAASSLLSICLAPLASFVYATFYLCIVLYSVRYLFFYSSKKNVAMGWSGPLFFLGQEEDRVAMKHILRIVLFFPCLTPGCSSVSLVKSVPELAMQDSLVCLFRGQRDMPVWEDAIVGARVDFVVFVCFLCACMCGDGP